MTHIFLTLLCLCGSTAESLWQLRAGLDPGPIILTGTASLYFSALHDESVSMTAGEMRRGVIAGNTSLIVPLAARLVSEGDIRGARIFWSNPSEIPATRYDLLAEVSWFNRYDLYQILALRPPTPPDMEDSTRGDHSAAVCAAGWMSTRSDGLFHADAMVTRGDLTILESFFPGIRADRDFVSINSLRSLFSGRESGLP
jgi:hypothetical protein